jgi:undecaprenyl-diphosphatase
MIWNWLTNIDNRVLYFLNDGRRHNAVFDLAATLISVSGDVLIFSFALILLLLPRKADKIAGLAILVSMEVSYQLSHGLKELIARPRPLEALTGIVPTFSATDFSMPSGHAVMAFSAAYIMTRSYGKGLLFYSLAALVAVSRVYAGVHFPTDVLAGAVIGVLTGIVVVKISEMAFSGQSK